MAETMDNVVTFLTASYPFASELQAFGIALQGAMAVRNGANKDGKMHWFHAFALTTLLAFGGGWFGFLLMGKPTSMITGGDVNVTCCVIAFLAVNYTPLDIGYKILSSFPGKIFVTIFAQMFRCTGTIKFINTGFQEISPTPYYPIPVIGPILYGTMLGNMGGFFVKGFDGYLKNGVPWPFQNGIFIGTFYHLFANDKEGVLGTNLRSIVKSVVDGEQMFGLDDTTFAHVVMASFMLITGVIMLPEFFGPSFSPIAEPAFWLGRSLSSKLVTSESSSVKRIPSPERTPEASVNGSAASAGKKGKNKRKKKKTA
mmetsp:Transcript_118984/g.344141  ORF Transcript_118984/g.344141 Transcript_118984/m.344141 type:complete len:313 (+) Transcript_118984:332-1270(+)